MTQDKCQTCYGTGLKITDKGAIKCDHNNSEQLKELFEKFDSLSPKFQIFFSSFLDKLISKVDLLSEQKSNGYFDSPMFINEIEETKYSVKFTAEHEKNDLDALSKTEYAYQDAVFKIQALFWSMSNLSNWAASGHHKYNLEKMLGSFESL